MYGLSMNHQLYKRTEVGGGTEFFIFAHQCLQHKELYCRFLLSPLFKHSHEMTSLEEENFLIHNGPCCSFPMIFTAYHRDLGSRWLKINSLSPLFAFMFKCHEQLGFRFKFECNSETRLPCLDFSFVHSSRVVHKCVPACSPQSLLQIPYLTLPGEVMVLRKHL